MLPFELFKNRNAWIVELRDLSYSIYEETHAILEAHFPVPWKWYSLDVDC